MKRDWFPETKSVEDSTYFHFQKFDRGVVMALTGKGLELRSGKEPHLLNGRQFDAILAARNTEAQRRYTETMTQMAENIGEEWNPSRKVAKVKTEHKLVVGLTLDVTLPAFSRGEKVVGPIEAKCLWGVGQDELWLELNTQILEYLSVTMQKDEAAEPIAPQPPAEPNVSHPSSSPPKRKRRRFQPQKSPKRKSKKNKAVDQTAEGEVEEPAVESQDVQDSIGD